MRGRLVVSILLCGLLAACGKPPATNATNATNVAAPLPAPAPSNAVAAAPGPVTVSAPPLTATVLAADRADGQLHVRVRIANPGEAAATGAVLNYADVHALDPASQQSYPLVKGADGQFLAAPVDSKANGGSFSLSKVAPHHQRVFELRFAAPPATVTAVDLVLPPFPPLQHVPIAGG
jgi:hypothetical protein